MNITFMIGNGFDVNLGLKTKFTDFYETYFKSELDRDVPDSVKNFIQLFLNDKEKFGNMDKWSDFEMAFAENVQGTVEEIGEILEDFTIQFAEYLKKEEEKCDYSDIKNYAEFRDFMFLNYNFLLKKQREFVINRTKSSNTLVWNFINFNYTSTLENLISLTNKSLTDFAFLGKRKADCDFKEVLHIHGDLKSNIIIGVDRYEQFNHQIVGYINEIEEYTVKRSINYFSGERNRELFFNAIIIKSNLIYMYGLSIGETDRTRWDIVKSWLESDIEHKLIYFAYDETLKHLNEIFLQKMVKKHNSIKNEVLMKLGFAPDEFEKYYDQVYIIDSSAVLNFKLVDENKEPEANMN